MSAPRPSEADVEALAGVLAEHRSSRPAFIREADGNDWHQGVSICICGETFTGSHDTHLAAVLAAREADAATKARAEGAAKALRDLADDIDPTGYGWTSVVNAMRFKERLRDRAARIMLDGGR